MTVSEMHIEFNLELKAQGAHEDFEPEEIDIFLNRSVRAFVDERREALRENESALADLRTLIQTEELTGGDIAAHSLFDNVVAGDLTKLSESFEYAVAGRAAITEGTTTKVLRFMGLGPFLDEILGEAHSPVFRRLPATVEGTSILVLHDETDTGIESVLLTYLRPPEKIDYATPTASDLPAHTHLAIVSRAVALARQAIATTE